METTEIVKLEEAAIYQEEHLVLSQVNLSLRTGTFHFLIGATGSGKSSLLKTLYGELKLRNGQGEVCGYDLTQLKTRDIPPLRRKLGIVFQDFQLLNDRSVNENLKFVLKATGWKDLKAMEQRIKAVLEQVNMETKGHKMPHQLSGGEQQRVAIARALLNEPELILADEPTGNLDPSTSEEIMILLEQIQKKDRAILMATHDYSLILKFPHQTLKCEDGRVFSTVQNTL